MPDVWKVKDFVDQHNWEQHQEMRESEHVLLVSMLLAASSFVYRGLRRGKSVREIGNDALDARMPKGRIPWFGLVLLAIVVFFIVAQFL